MVWDDKGQKAVPMELESKCLCLCVCAGPPPTVGTDKTDEGGPGCPLSVHSVQSVVI